MADTSAEMMHAEGGWLGGCGRPVLFRYPRSLGDPFDVLMLLTHTGVFEVVERIEGVVPRAYADGVRHAKAPSSLASG